MPTLLMCQILYVQELNSVKIVFSCCMCVIWVIWSYYAGNTGV